MFKLFKRIFQIAILFIIFALIFNLKYNGTSSRTYAEEYGTKVFAYLYQLGKNLIGKDLKEIGPEILPTVKEKFKEFSNEPQKEKPSQEGVKKNEPKKQSQDKLTDEDREKLNKLLKEKSQKK